MGLPNPKKAFVEWPPAAVRGFFFGRTLVRTGVSTAMTLICRMGKDL
jgi:hypothetical protein